MKTILVVATAAIVATLTTFGQGQGVVTFTSIGAPDSKKIVGCDGTYCSGTAYAVALYWGPATATDDRNLIQTGGSASFLTGANAGTYQSKYAQWAQTSLATTQGILRGVGLQGKLLATEQGVLSVLSRPAVMPSCLPVRGKEMRDPRCHRRWNMGCLLHHF